MDVDLARTFLAIVETGSFVEAGKKVFVTQSTVSARIKTLEEQLGKTLFSRSKSGAVLTPAGIQFQKHAQSMVRIWQHARLEIALPEGYHSALSVGGQYSLWENYLLNWLARMRSVKPDLAIRAQMGFSNGLMQGLLDGSIDLGVMYTPQARPGFEVEMLFEDELVLVSCQPGSNGHPGDDYVLIDWGPEFRADHALNFPEISVPGTYLELGSLSLQYLMQSASSGYVPYRIAKPYLSAGTLHLSSKAPAFSYPAYVAYSTDIAAEVIDVVLSELHRIAETTGSD